jgi:hypothetical protein
MGRFQSFVLFGRGIQWWRFGSTRQLDLPRNCLQLIVAYDLFRFVRRPLSGQPDSELPTAERSALRSPVDNSTFLNVLHWQLANM